MNGAKQRMTHPVRFWFVLGLLFCGLILLAARAFYLQVARSDYLQRQGDARYLRTVEVAASRGMILDRHGEPLAISTPVDSVWANPAEFATGRSLWPALAAQLELSLPALERLYAKHAEREFMYLKRHVVPAAAQRIMALKVPGVALRREYKRYYPTGAIAGHVVGFTNIDDEGQEGLELAYNSRLGGRPGKKLVLKDGRRHTVEDVASIRRAVDGRNLTITLDNRIQYLAYRELKAAIRAHKARSGSVVMLDAKTGEVLAMVNEPDFNPNNRAQLRSTRFRNRAVTDVFEPGSTVKPFTIAAALESKKFSPDSRVDTTPGTFRIGKYTVRDMRDYGVLTVSRVIVKSSNVGASKIALALSSKTLWRMFNRAGLGISTASGLPGESAGRLARYQDWRPIEHATIAYGYGVAVTPLQLAHAYASLANGGVLMPATLVRRSAPVMGQRVMSPVTAKAVIRMLELAVGEQGTGGAARIARYRVAGKTGTMHKSTPGGYAKHRYVAAFAGLAPVSDPQLVMAVVIDDPIVGNYFGGEVAAPVFARVMAGALRLRNIAPDAPAIVNRDIAASGGAGPA